MAANPLTIAVPDISTGLDTFDRVDCDDSFLGEVTTVPSEETSRRSNLWARDQSFPP
jgi:hypothetical protein